MLRALAAKAASAQRGVAPAGPQTQAERVSLKQAIEAAVDETTDSNISRGGARAVATAVMARPDHYAGQIVQEVKITIDKDRENSAQGSWKEDQGHPSR